MDLKRMEVFCKIIELKSFTRAGEALSLAQPTVSEHIRALENMLGEKLLDRFKGEILPTPVGRLFYKYAKNIIQMRDEAFQAVEQFRGKLEGQLNLAASTIPGTYILPKLIGEFKAAHPGSQIALHISDTIGTAEAVAEGRVDLGMVGAKWGHPKLTFEEIGSDELLLTVSSSHSWAQARIIEPLDLAQEPFLLREAGSGTRMVIKQILEDHGLSIRSLNVIAEIGSTDSVKQGVKDGIGVSILSALAVSDELCRGTLVSVEIRGISFQRSFYLIKRKNRQASPLCSAFIDHLRERN
ncbi:MAG: selenium metabolism-associated LysR family transcriptional regulator [Deltaproteobacteria bacterium]|nr:selenium metabolism-associated LysR family transcriptional regulator [Deltaproteobacteria bacterium]